MRVAYPWRRYPQYSKGCNQWGKNTHDGHALFPTVVSTESQEEVTTVGSEPISEVLGTGPDVVTLETSHKGRQL